MDENEFLSESLLLDLETNSREKIYQVGAVFQNRTFELNEREITGSGFQSLDEFAANASYILGHNIVEHDLPILRKVYPDLSILKLPVIDTLYLSPLAFPENPYHKLVKNYILVRDSANNPVNDARLAGKVFCEQWESFGNQFKVFPDLIRLFAYCFHQSSLKGDLKDAYGMSHIFNALISNRSVSLEDAQDCFLKLATGRTCPFAASEICRQTLDSDKAILIPYCAAWLQVSGGNSVLPGWVRHRFPDISSILTRLREAPCENEECPYCSKNHHPKSHLKRFFGFDDFRPAPEAEDGSSLQRQIVTTGMRGEPMLAILPTGGGKSLCYQLPALIRYQRRGLLTIVISPLQALMKDQVDNMNSLSVGAIYGMLTPPERRQILDRVRLGDIAILYISPEQLRNNSVRDTIAQREIGCWVFDEAHCLSKWGHDFRPDYLYASRFIREFSEKHQSHIPPVACYTATAKLDVINEITEHFKKALDQELTVFHSTVERTNLSFRVLPSTAYEKNDKIHELLSDSLQNTDGSAIVYAAKRSRTEEIAEYLEELGHNVRAFHAGLDAAEKRKILEDFVSGAIQVISATNAFGMGIDKDNVRLVIHADIPGSLENYLQEAGRAGRDLNIEAECILLFDPSDLDSQFSLEKRSELTQKDIAGILRTLRQCRKGQASEVIVTSGEIARFDDIDYSFDPAESSSDTKIRTGIAWLERAGYLERNMNQTSVFQGKPTVETMAEAEKKIDSLNLKPKQKEIWLSILHEIFNAEIDEGLQADQIAESAIPYDKSTGEIGSSELTPSQKVIRILNQMVEAGLLKKGIQLSAFVKSKGRKQGIALLDDICVLENALLNLMKEEDPDSDKGEWVDFHLIKISQRLKSSGFDNAPDTLKQILKGISLDGKGLAGKKGSLVYNQVSKEIYKVKLQRTWAGITETVKRRQAASMVILNYLMGKLPGKRSGEGNVLIEFTCEELIDELKKDMELRGLIEDHLAVIERCLIQMHDMRIITLQGGLAVFRQAMRINLLPEKEKARYNKGDYKPLELHYTERVFQIHVMGEYARLGIEKLRQALRLVFDYFEKDKKSFFRKYFEGREDEVAYPANPETFCRIVDELGNAQQQEIVANDMQSNILVLAGPGSGKTKVIVHRCAYLLCVQQVRPSSILILCYNHNAAVSLKKRLIELVGHRGRFVMVSTYHALAMRLTGISFCDETLELEQIQFKKAISDATALLTGNIELPGIDAEEQRERLLGGIRTILVDEYQDIDSSQYNFISAIAGREIEDKDEKISIMAVGDDDQNIYSFRGTNIEYIQKFQEDYRVYPNDNSKKPYQVALRYLTENYRSSTAIIDIANRFIEHNRDRMKSDYPIRINRSRQDEPPGGRWEHLDPERKGKVLIINVPDLMDQPLAIIGELNRLKNLNPDASWSDFAILACTHATLVPIRLLLEKNGIPVSYRLNKDDAPPLHRTREIRDFLVFLHEKRKSSLKISELKEAYETSVKPIPKNIWGEILDDLLKTLLKESGDASIAVGEVIDYLYDNLAEYRNEQVFGNGVFLSTMHGAKGMEFSHVFIPDGGWETMKSPKTEDNRRLFYVAMTRAMETLTIISASSALNPHIPLLRSNNCLVSEFQSRATNKKDLANKRFQMIGLKNLYLGFPGTFHPKARIHDDLAALAPGSPVTLSKENDGIVIRNSDDRTVSKLAKSAIPAWEPILPKIEQVNILAMIRRLKTDEAPEYQPSAKSDEWELPIIEVLYSL